METLTLILSGASITLALISIGFSLWSYKETNKLNKETTQLLTKVEGYSEKTYKENMALISETINHFFKKDFGDQNNKELENKFKELTKELLQVKAEKNELEKEFGKEKVKSQNLRKDMYSLIEDIEYEKMSNQEKILETEMIDRLTDEARGK